MKSFLPFVCFIAGTVFAQNAPSKIPKVVFSDTTLENGLRVIIAEDHYAPVYAIAISYKVGSRDERKGRTGFAHLFEHMMFKGSENVGPGELDYLIYTNGGSLNGTTNNDRTLYFETLPRNQLDLGLFLEADRMKGLVITAENLENQRQAVKEERRMRRDNQPYGEAAEKYDELVYDNFAYRHPVIGSMADLDAATVDDVKEFFKIYYAPNNAVLALVGDVNTKEALAKVKKYFGSIPRQEAPKPVDLAEPPKEGERRAKLEDKLARLALLDIGYRTNGAKHPDEASLNVLGMILGGRENSRLSQLLVRDKEMVLAVSANSQRHTGPSTFNITATVRPGKTPQEVESLIQEEIAKLHSAPVTDKELQRVRAGLRRAAVSRISMLGRAQALADAAALYDDPNRVNTELDKQMAVTAEDIQRVVKKYMVASNRVVVETLPVAGAGGMRGRRPESQQ